MPNFDAGQFESLVRALEENTSALTDLSGAFESGGQDDNEVSQPGERNARAGGGDDVLGGSIQNILRGFIAGGLGAGLATATRATDAGLRGFFATNDPTVGTANARASGLNALSGIPVIGAQLGAELDPAQRAAARTGEITGALARYGQNVDPQLRATLFNEFSRQERAIQGDRAQNTALVAADERVRAAARATSEGLRQTASDLVDFGALGGGGAVLGGERVVDLLERIANALTGGGGNPR